MGVTIQFESHRVELAAVYELEHNRDVLEYWDQPNSIKLDYESAHGRHLGVLHTPDYFVIRRTEAGWEECKTEEDLRRLAERNANRYFHDDNGRWRCPPGEAYAHDLDLYYRVRSSRDINWVFQRNIQFLEDYLRADSSGPTTAVRENVLAFVSASPGITLSDLFEASEKVADRDAAYWMIALGELHVDLAVAALVEPEKVRVYPHKPAVCASEPMSMESQRKHQSGVLDFNPGGTLEWDGKAWRIANVGNNLISLVGEQQSFVELPLNTFETLVVEGRLKAVSSRVAPPLNAEAVRRIAEANENDLRVANQRFELVSRHLRGEPVPQNSSVKDRTMRVWVAQYRQAEAEFGSGYLGLLPRTRQRGNRESKLPEATRTLMTKFIANNYESLKQRKMQASWAALTVACESQGTVAPSYKTFSIAVRRRPRFQQTLEREGQRAAYQEESFYWELDQRTPRHGDRPFEIVHIDHTELDLQSVCSRTGQTLGRPWLTLLTDAFSRRILALFLTYDPPSYRSCMMVLRECVRRHARLPQIVAVDNGGEFKSTYFETLLARYECLKKTRPPAMPRFGSVCERILGTTNTQFVYNLQGNTQLTRRPRMVTNATDPRGQAVWPLADLFRSLCEYAYEVYDTTMHPALGTSPREAYTAGLDLTGQRLHRMVRYDQEFLMFTMPTTPKGTARVVPSRGVKIRYLYYWCDRFRDPNVEAQPAEVRYDPFDAGTAYAFVQNQWEECHSEYFSVFRGRSEKEILLASQELRRMREKHSQHRWLSARQLAVFLESVEAQEALLTQRWIDRENQSVRELVGVGSTAASAGSFEGVSRADPTSETEGLLTNGDRPAKIYGDF
jgi:transposase InsO family protein